MRQLGVEVYGHTARYDGAIYNYLSGYFKTKQEEKGISLKN